MDFIGLFAGIVIGAGLGIPLTWLVLRLRFSEARVSLETRLNASDQRLRDYQQLHEDTTRKMSDTFNSLASDALKSNNESFLQLAKQALETQHAEAQGDLDLRTHAIESLVKPLSETLTRLEGQRQSDFGGLKQMAESMVKGQQELAAETRNLSQALRTPQVRGRWGEMTLRRVAELAGMVRNCDFAEQEVLGGQAGGKRPDMVVHLPNERRIAVDAKTPMDAYLQAVEAESEQARSAALKHHSRQVRDRVRELANKSYWAALGYTPEFVVLFLPGEFLLGPALQEDPGLMEQAMRDRVVIATPSTLISLLHAVAYGWRQEQLAVNAQDISTLGQEMHDRLAVWANHLVRLRDSLAKSVEAFNDSVGSLEHRVLVSSRRFKQMGIGGDKEVPSIEPIALTLRALSGPE